MWIGSVYFSSWRDMALVAVAAVLEISFLAVLGWAIFG